MAIVTMKVSFPTNVLEADDHDALNDAAPETNLQSASVNKTPPAAGTPPVGRYNSVSKSAVLKLSVAEWIDMCGRLRAGQQTLTINYDDTPGTDASRYQILGFSFENA